MVIEGMNATISKACAYVLCYAPALLEPGYETIHHLNQIIVQSAWNESAEHEKQFNIPFWGVGVTTPGSNQTKVV